MIARRRQQRGDGRAGQTAAGFYRATHYTPAPSPQLPRLRYRTPSPAVFSHRAATQKGCELRMQVASAAPIAAQRRAQRPPCGARQSVACAAAATSAGGAFAPFRWRWRSLRRSRAQRNSTACGVQVCLRAIDLDHRAPREATGEARRPARAAPMTAARWRRAGCSGAGRCLR